MAVKRLWTEISRLQPLRRRTKSDESQLLAEGHALKIRPFGDDESLTKRPYRFYSPSTLPGQSGGLAASPKDEVLPTRVLPVHN
jgi:hypothetical protein